VGYLGWTAHRLSITGHITAASVRLAWRSDAHSGTGLALLVTGLAIFAAGSVLTARPFARNRATWLVAVPIAAILGMLVFGVFALLIAALVDGGLNWGDFADGPSRRRKGRRLLDDAEPLLHSSDHSRQRGRERCEKCLS